MFFYKERKRVQRSFRSFIKKGKERKDRSVLLKRTDAQPWSQLTPLFSHQCGNVFPFLLSFSIFPSYLVYFGPSFYLSFFLSISFFLSFFLSFCLSVFLSFFLSIFFLFFLSSFFLTFFLSFFFALPFLSKPCVIVWLMIHPALYLSLPFSKYTVVLSSLIVKAVGDLMILDRSLLSFSLYFSFYILYISLLHFFLRRYTILSILSSLIVESVGDLVTDPYLFLSFCIPHFLYLSLFLQSHLCRRTVDPDRRIRE